MDASTAIVVMLGYGIEPAPRNNAAVLTELSFIERRRADEALKFANALEPNWTDLADDLAGATEWARTNLKSKFPELTDEALNALAWACSYGWR